MGHEGSYIVLSSTPSLPKGLIPVGVTVKILEALLSMIIIIIIIIIIKLYFIIKIYTAKSRPSTPIVLYSFRFLLLMKSVTWFFHDCCGLPLLVLQCGIHWYILFDQRLPCILKRYLYPFNYLL